MIKINKEMKSIIHRKGYKIIDSYRANSGQIKVIVKDGEGYKYDVQLHDIISPTRNVHYFVSPGNPFSLENISLWLKKMELNFVLCENNEYVGKESELFFICYTCGDIFSKSWNDVRNYPSCPICSNRKVGSSNNLLIKYPESKNVWNYDKNEDAPENYLCTNTSLVWWYCENEEHETFQRTIWNSTRCDFMCPKCSRNKKNSKLHNLVVNYLFELGFELNFERECSLLPKNPDNNYLMPYDIEVTNIFLIIEIQGEQHSKMGGWHKKLSERDPWGRSPMEMFQYQQWKDEYKKNFAIENGYGYLEIPYDSIYDDFWKQLLDEKLK